MFIYFPEYFYKQIKEITKSTFRNEINSKNIEDLVKDSLSSDNLYAEFRQEKIKLPTLNLTHCIHLDPLKPISNYSIIHNTITICKNLIHDEIHFRETFNKELYYSYILNTNRNDSASINELVKITLKACRHSINSILDLKSNKDEKLNVELIKRCSYNELKFKFPKEIKEFYTEYDNNEIKLNSIIRNLIDQNKI